MTVTLLRSFPSVADLLAEARAGLHRLTPAEAAASGLLLVDVRPHAERAADGEVPGALVLERSALEFADLPGQVVLLSTHGDSSSLAAASLGRLGVHATDVVGGFEAWAAAGLAVVPGGTPAGRRTPERAAVELDVDRWELRVGGQDVAVTVQEFRVLEALLRARGRVVTRRALAEDLDVWPATSRALDVHVCRLRAKLGEAATRLVTVRGVGWRFVAD